MLPVVLRLRHLQRLVGKLLVLDVGGGGLRVIGKHNLVAIQILRVLDGAVGGLLKVLLLVVI